MMMSFLRSALAAAMLLSVPLSAASSKTSKKATPPGKKPSVRVDTTPVGDHKALVVQSYAEVVEPAQKAVVSVYSTKIIKERISIHPFLRQFFGEIPERESKQEGLGSGVIVTSDGYVLTNNHVVEGADELKVTLSDDRDFIAKVIGTDPKTDVAVLKIDGTDLPAVTLADSDKLRVGDVVFAMGNPLGIGQTVTMGIVSAKGRSKLGLLENVAGYEDFIQTDAAINMGNSGGALIDARGRLVGINSAIISPSRGNIGIGFAIPSNLTATIMNSLVETGTVARGYLGITSETVTADIAEQLGLPKDTKGAIITDIYADSPAEKAGLKRADVVLAFNHQPIHNWEDLRLMIAKMAPDSRATVRVVRDGKERTIEVTLGRVTENPNELFTGVDVEPLSPAHRRRLGIIDPRIAGLVVTAVADDSPFREQLAPNMVIIELNRTAVPDLATAKELVRPGRNLLAVYSGGSIRFIIVSVSTR